MSEVHGRFACRASCHHELSVRLRAEARSQAKTMAFVMATISLLALIGAIASFGMVFKENITTQNAWLDDNGNWHVGPQITRRISGLEKVCYGFGGVFLLGCGSYGLITAVQHLRQDSPASNET